MEIITRDYRRTDAAQVVVVFKDSCQSLRKSQGGTHPDEAIDGLFGGSDTEILARFAGGTKLFVAEVRDTGEIVGTGGLARGPIDRLIGSACSTSHYVKRAFQRGRAGVGIGTLLKKASIEKAKALGCRKMYGFSTPEAVEFHRKFGARYFPQYDRRYLGGAVSLHYNELELRPSRWNALKLEPYSYAMNGFFIWFHVTKILLSATARSVFSPGELVVWLQLAKELAFGVPGKKQDDTT